MDAKSSAESAIIADAASCCIRDRCEYGPALYPRCGRSLGEVGFDAPACTRTSRGCSTRLCRPMPPLRILHVVSYAPDAWAYGGIPRVVAALGLGLAQRGHEVTVVASDACDRTRRLIRSERTRDRRARFSPGADGIDLRLFPNLSNRLAYDLQLFLPIGLRRFLVENAGRFDVAHLHALRNLPTAWAASALGDAGVPFVFTPNGTAPRIERRKRAKAAWDFVFGRAPLDRAAKLLAVSSAEERQFVELGISPERVTQLPNPIDLLEFEKPIQPGVFRRRHGLEQARLVLFLGRISPRKGVDVLVEAFSRLKGEELHLAIVGEEMGAGRAVRDALRDHGVGGRSLLPGVLTGLARIEALADADVVAYPAKDEIFGLVPFEALLAGTPVVVADDSGCGELVRSVGGGLLVPAGDVGSLSEALERILSAPESWRAEAAIAAVEIRRRFGAKEVCRRLEEIYFEVLARQRESGGARRLNSR